MAHHHITARGLPLMQCNSFAEAAYNDNSIDELIDALSQMSADPADMKAWNITATQWREQIALALRHMVADAIEEAGE
ncbi:MAG: hypothetical protein AAFQ36_09380 [Pseudomonadota bacterium]